MTSMAIELHHQTTTTAEHSDLTEGQTRIGKYYMLFWEADLVVLVVMVGSFWDSLYPKFQANLPNLPLGYRSSCLRRDNHFLAGNLYRPESQ